jgi:hypothetical protein
MAALQHGDVVVDQVGAVTQRPAGRAVAVLESLQADGLVRVADGRISLG